MGITCHEQDQSWAWASFKPLFWVDILCISRMTMLTFAVKQNRMKNTSKEWKNEWNGSNVSVLFNTRYKQVQYAGICCYKNI